MKQILTHGLNDVELHYLRSGYPVATAASPQPAPPGTPSGPARRPRLAALLRRLRWRLSREAARPVQRPT